MLKTANVYNTYFRCFNISLFYTLHLGDLLFRDVTICLSLYGCVMCWKWQKKGLMSGADKILYFLYFQFIWFKTRKFIYDYYGAKCLHIVILNCNVCTMIHFIRAKKNI